MNELLADKMVVIRQGHEKYEVWAMDAIWNQTVKKYQYTGTYTRLIATFKSDYKAKQYVGPTDE